MTIIENFEFDNKSAKIQQITEIIQEVRAAVRLRPSTEPVSSYRLQAVKSISARCGIQVQSINDKLIRKCRPDINRVHEFDELLDAWLRGSDDLRQILLKHALTEQERELVNRALGRE